MSLLVVCEGIQRAYCMVTALTVGVRLRATAEQHDTVLYKGAECGMEMEISAKYLEGNDGFALLVIPHSWLSRTPWSMGCGHGCGSDGDTLDSGDVPGIRLGWGRMGLVWPVGSPITTSRGCLLGPMRDRVLLLLERWQCCVPWCAKFVASLFYSAGRSDCSSAVVAMINLPARSFLVVLYVL